MLNNANVFPQISASLLPSIIICTEKRNKTINYSYSIIQCIHFNVNMNFIYSVFNSISVHTNILRTPELHLLYIYM